MTHTATIATLATLASRPERPKFDISDWLVPCRIEHEDHTQTETVVYVVTAYFGGCRAYAHFKRYESRAGAERLLARVRAARPSVDHITTSPHWAPHPYEDGDLSDRLAIEAHVEQAERAGCHGGYPVDVDKVRLSAQGRLDRTHRRAHTRKPSALTLLKLIASKASGYVAARSLAVELRGKDNYAITDAEISWIHARLVEMLRDGLIKAAGWHQPLHGGQVDIFRVSRSTSYTITADGQAVLAHEDNDDGWVADRAATHANNS